MPDLVATEDPHVGQVFDGRYEIISRIGEGGMGVVYRARQIAMDRPIALKVLRASRQTQEAAIARFLREMRTTSRIRHPNVVNVFDFGETEDGEFFLAMELIEGETLKERLDRVGTLSIDEASAVSLQILGALGAAHKEGIVHRDIKPENIMLLEMYGESDQVRVLDFGIARFVEGHEDEGHRVTRTGSFVGTPHYASPEQAVGDDLDGRSDLYAFGVLLYRMVTGRLPFDAPGKPLRVLRMQMTERPPLPSSVATVSIPEWFDGLVMTLLEKFPEERPDSAGAVAQAIARNAGTSETLEISDALGMLKSTRPAADLPEKVEESTSDLFDGKAMMMAALVAAVAAAIAGMSIGLAY